MRSRVTDLLSSADNPGLKNWLSLYLTRSEACTFIIAECLSTRELNGDLALKGAFE
jgi:hypothetical protein